MAQTPAIIGHRGFAGAFPENTVGAAVAAATHPRCDGIEIDVQPSRDGEIVVFHDRDMGARNDGSPGLTTLDGPVWKQPIEAVTEANVLGSEWSVPRLETLLEALPGGTHVVVELKNPGSDRTRPAASLDETELEKQRTLWAPFVDRVVETVDTAEADVDVRLTSFCEAAVAEAARYDYDTGIVCIGANARESIAFAERFDCAEIHAGMDALVGDYRGEPPGFDVVDAGHDTTLDVVGWTAHTWHDMRRMADAGVDAITTHYPSLPVALDEERVRVETAASDGGSD